MTFWLIVLGLLSLALAISQFFVRRRQPMLGFALGILPILAGWLYISLQAEMALYTCRNDVRAICEWTGIGIAIFTLLALILILICAVAVGVMDVARIFWRRKSFFGNANAGLYPWPVWLSLMAIVILMVMGSFAGFLLSDVVRTPVMTWFAPFVAVVGGTLWALVRERRTVNE